MFEAGESESALSRCLSVRSKKCQHVIESPPARWNKFRCFESLTERFLASFLDAFSHVFDLLGDPAELDVSDMGFQGFCAFAVAPCCFYACPVELSVCAADLEEVGWCRPIAFFGETSSYMQHVKYIIWAAS
ncbi:hypothetical protein KCV07_g426, partial [Aureobasidium melanogenum]